MAHVARRHASAHHPKVDRMNRCVVADDGKDASLADLPVLSGSYALWLSLPHMRWITVGRLGTFRFPAGDYVYLGSAYGPGGLRARVGHHLRLAAKPHWHLDWLRPYGTISAVWYSLAAGDLECAWSQALARLPEASVPAPGFGAADCAHGCPAHLVAFPLSFNWDRLYEFLQGSS